MTSYLVASKDGDVGDNSGMTCGAIDEGIVEASGANGVDDVDGGNIVSFVDRHACQPTRPPPLPRPRIGYILIVMDDIRGLMDEPYDVDTSSTKEMQWSSPIERKTEVAI